MSMYGAEIALCDINKHNLQLKNKIDSKISKNKKPKHFLECDINTQ
jgi:hypothetical protein